MDNSQILGVQDGFAYYLITLTKIATMFGIIMVTVAYSTFAERRVSAFIQDRLGPNRVGPMGLLQPIADGLKNLFKEETMPASASRLYFLLGPMMAMIPALVTFAVIPFAAPLPTRWGVVPMVIADVPIGVLYILALSSLSVYGVVIAGWASNNKYAFLGGLRASAQMISYEVGLGLSLISVLLLAGNVTLTEIVSQQQQLGLWFAFPLSLGFILFLICAFAETNRLPFDMPEAESELITGFHTEYSAMKFSMFFIAEYAHMVTASALMATLFFGGWDLPGSWDDMFFHEGIWVTGFAGDGTPLPATLAIWKTLLTFLGFALKTGFFLFLYIWIRWTLPRFRYDQVMELGWKIILPISLAYAMVLAAAMLGLFELGMDYGFTFGLALTVVSGLCTLAFVFLLDRGGTIGGAASGKKMTSIEDLP